MIDWSSLRLDRQLNNIIYESLHLYLNQLSPEKKLNIILKGKFNFQLN